jgi:hypothetical protein
LGTAVASVVIDVSQPQQVVATMQRVGQDTARAFAQIDTAAKKTELSLKSMFGALGVGFGAQQLAQFAIHADEVATAYARQSVAAVSLAGSQEKLNALMTTYDKVTGGAIDKANLLAQVTQLQAIGFADSTREIEQFATAVRGISLATGRPQDYVQQQLQLAIANQSVMRLDQIGLGVDEVKNKVNELKAANSSLSEAQAYQNAVLTIADQKFGKLSRSAAGQATELELARKAWKDFTLEIGQEFAPATASFLEATTNELRKVAERLESAARLVAAAKKALDDANKSNANSYSAWGTTVAGAKAVFGWEDPITAAVKRFDRSMSPVVSNATRPYDRQYAGGMADTPSGPSAEQLAEQRQARLDFAQTMADIDRDAADQRLDATRQYESQRTDTIRDYERTIAREAEDFGRQRARAEAQFAKQIADVQADTAEREAEAAEDFAERITDAQEATAKRISDIEENYRRNRERAERTHRDNLLDAAARLDATAVFNEMRRFNREAEEAKTAHDDQISQEQENLAERLQQEQENHAERLAEAREADAERLEDMQEAFEEQKAQEDEDRALRLERMAEDHADQLAEMDSAHALRIEQINQHAAEEREAAQEAHLKEMQALGVVLSQGWTAIQKAIEEAMLKEYDRFALELNKRYAVQGPMTPGEAGALDPWRGGNLLNPQPLPSGGGNTRNFNVAPGAITVIASPGQSAQSVAAAVRVEMVEIFRELSN